MTHTQHKACLRVLFTAAVVACMLSSAQGGEVTLTWAFPTNSIGGGTLGNITGAKIYYGTASSNYTHIVDAGNTNTYTVTGLVAGQTYYFNGTAYTDTGYESDLRAEEEQVAVADNAANEAPNVSAVEDLKIHLPSTVLLTATATDDGLPSGSHLTYAWTKAAGPGSVIFSDETALETEASFSAAGVYIVQISVSDGDKISSDSVVVTATQVPAPAPPRNLRTLY